MKEFTYNNLTDGNGEPIREWVTDEEWVKRTKDIQDRGQCLKDWISVTNSNNQETIQE